MTIEVRAKINGRAASVHAAPTGRRVVRLVCALVMVVVIMPSAAAKTWTVRTDGTGDFTSIQDAIWEATHGDEVFVGPGTYSENIDFLGRRITLRSEMGPEATTIDGSGRDSSVVVLRSGETLETTLEGFTITGGRGSPLGASIKIGGGIHAPSRVWQDGLAGERSRLRDVGHGRLDRVQ